jgi:hypothetical protein
MKIYALITLLAVGLTKMLDTLLLQGIFTNTSGIVMIDF